jgi:hypothetical protein
MGCRDVRPSFTLTFFSVLLGVMQTARRAFAVGRRAFGAVQVLARRTARFGWRQTYRDWSRHGKEEQGGVSNV